MLSCSKNAENEQKKLNLLACEYVRLGLTIGQYDADFVDAYYGPDSLKPTTPKKDFFPKDSLIHATDDLINQFKEAAASAANVGAAD